MIESHELHAKDLILQEYIDGREFTVAVVEVDGNPVVLPALEVVFKPRPHVMISGHSDWDMKPVFPENRSLAQTARRVFSRLQMRDYARIDIRMRNRDIYVLDVNSLPNLDPERSYLPLAAKCAGLSFARLITLLITSSLHRASGNTRHPDQQPNGVRKQYRRFTLL
jgi:D-alanine-D-alanine ligase